MSIEEEGGWGEGATRALRRSRQQVEVGSQKYAPLVSIYGGGLIKQLRDCLQGVEVVHFLVGCSVRSRLHHLEEVRFQWALRRRIVGSP